MLNQRGKAFLTASYRQFIVKATSIQNATASCFHCGSTQKKTPGQGQHRLQAFLLQQKDEFPYMKLKKQKLSVTNEIPPLFRIISHSQKIHKSYFSFLILVNLMETQLI